MGSFQKPQDATRQERKAKKRKLEDAVLDVPSDNEINTEQADGGAGKLAKKWRRDRDADGEGRGLIEDVEREERETTKARWQREANGDATEVSIAEGELTFAKKEKNCRDKKFEEFMMETATEKLVTETQEEAETAPKSKKERKATRRAKDAAEAAEAAALSMHGPPIVESRFEAEENTDGDANTATPEGGKNSKKNNHRREKRLKAATVAPEGSGDVSGNEEVSESKEKKNDRFICFIGNLPFTANTESIFKHFAAVKPISVRALTHKDNPTKSKGIAFVEFEGYDHMKTCLKVFHHSMFNDGLSPARKINVELTVGGGGNTKDRRAKIQGKNHKLSEQRLRRAQEGAIIRLEKSSSAVAIDHRSAIHPSRRTRVPAV